MIILLAANLRAGEMRAPVLLGQGCGARLLMPQESLGVAALAVPGSGSWGQHWALGRFGKHSLERRVCAHSEMMGAGCGSPHRDE